MFLHKKTRYSLSKSEPTEIIEKESRNPLPSPRQIRKSHPSSSHLSVYRLYHHHHRRHRRHRCLRRRRRRRRRRCHPTPGMTECRLYTKKKKRKAKKDTEKLHAIESCSPIDSRPRDWVGFVRFLRCLFSLCIILYRTQCDTTCLSTNVSCESKTWKAPYGRWTKWSFTRDVLNALAARPGTLPPSHRQKKFYCRVFYTLYYVSIVLFTSIYIFTTYIIYISYLSFSIFFYRYIHYNNLPPWYPLSKWFYQQQKPVSDHNPK